MRGSISINALYDLESIRNAVSDVAAAMLRSEISAQQASCFSLLVNTQLKVIKSINLESDNVKGLTDDELRKQIKENLNKVKNMSFNFNDTV